MPVALRFICSMSPSSISLWMRRMALGNGICDTEASDDMVTVSPRRWLFIRKSTMFQTGSGDAACSFSS